MVGMQCGVHVNQGGASAIVVFNHSRRISRRLPATQFCCIRDRHATQNQINRRASPPVAPCSLSSSVFRGRTRPRTVRLVLALGSLFSSLIASSSHRLAQVTLLSRSSVLLLAPRPPSF